MLSQFHIRNKIRWLGLKPIESNGCTPYTSREKELFKKYSLGRYADKISHPTLTETLGILDLLDRLPDIDFLPLSKIYDSTLKALDVGAKNWRYLGALSVWLQLKQKAQIEMTGIEIDAFRLDRNLCSRIGYARTYAELFSNSMLHFSYQASDILDFHSQVDFVTWFFPFLNLNPHRGWGLPKKFFRPSEVFDHVETQVLKPKGVLILANQGEWEWEIARNGFKKLNLLSFQQIEGSLHASPHPIFLSVWASP